MERFKQRMLRFFFGEEFIAFLTGQVKLNNTMCSELATIKTHQVEIAKLLKQLSEETGGKGWVKTVQQAIMHLDERIDTLTEVAEIHEKNFEKLNELEIIQATFDPDKQNLN